MAKSTSEKSKPTKAETAKKAAAKKAPATKQTPNAKAATAKADTAKPVASKKADPKKATATPKASKAGTDAGSALAKKCQEASSKFEKLGDAKYSEIKEKLEWCIGSYKHDQNPAGLVEYGRKAVGLLKEARAEKPKQVSQKLIDDLEKAIEKV